VVGSLRLRQGPLPRPPAQRQAPPAPDPAVERALSQGVAGVEHPGLRAALLQLGRSASLKGAPPSSGPVRA
jgi:hypothetical protein